MNVGFSGVQGQGKTKSVVAMVKYLTTRGGYDGTECLGNVDIHSDLWGCPGYRFMPNWELREAIKALYVGKSQKHKVIVCDEIDQLFPARFWSDKEQTETILGMWQDEKMFNYLLYTKHFGTSVDTIIRQATQVLVIPHIDKYKDVLSWHIINGVYMQHFYNHISNQSQLHHYYNRWATVS